MIRARANDTPRISELYARYPNLLEGESFTMRPPKTVLDEFVEHGELYYRDSPDGIDGALRLSGFPDERVWGYRLPRTLYVSHLAVARSLEQPPDILLDAMLDGAIEQASGANAGAVRLCCTSDRIDHVQAPIRSAGFVMIGTTSVYHSLRQGESVEIVLYERRV